MKPQQHDKTMEVMTNHNDEQDGKIFLKMPEWSDQMGKVLCIVNKDTHLINEEIWEIS